MGKPSFHGSIPNRAILDNRLSGTQMRLLGLYGFHDRLSLTNGVGKGCIASNKLLCSRLGCDYSTLIKLKGQLEDFGYIQTDKRESGRRIDVVRVVPDHLAPPKTWPFDPIYVGATCLSPWKKQDETATIAKEEQGETATNGLEKYGETATSPLNSQDVNRSNSTGNQVASEPQYIPLSGETYSSKEGVKYSSQEAQLASRAAGGGENDQFDDPVLRVNHSKPGKGGEQKKNGAEALAASGVSIWGKVREISKGWSDLPSEAQLCHFEKAFKAIGSNPNAIDSHELKEVQDWLFSVADASDETAIIHHARRLEEELMIY